MTAADNHVSLVLSLPEPLARALRDGLESQGMEDLADELSRQLTPTGAVGTRVEPTGMGAVVRESHSKDVWVRCDTDMVPWRCVSDGGERFGEWVGWSELKNTEVLAPGVEVKP